MIKLGQTMVLSRQDDRFVPNCSQRFNLISTIREKTLSSPNHSHFDSTPAAITIQGETISSNLSNLILVGPTKRTHYAQMKVME